MPPAIEELQAARKVMVRIVQARDDGAKFLPIVLALERIVAEGLEQSDELARILSEAA